MTRAVRGRRFEQRGRGFASEQIRQRRRVHNPPHDRIVGIGRRDDVLAGADRGQQRLRDVRIVDVAFGAELLENAQRLVQMALGDRARAGFGDQPAEREMAEAGLIALAEQVEQRRALREIVVRVGAAAALRVQRAAQPQVLAPRGRAPPSDRACRPPRRGDARPRAGDWRRSALRRRSASPAARRTAARRPAGFRPRAHTASSSARAAQREARAEHAHRPLVPLAGLTPVGAEGLAGAAEEIARGVVAAANQVNLRQRVEHGAGRFVKLNRAAHFERAVQRVFGAAEIAETHADLAERRERDREAVAGAVRFVQRRRCARRAPAPARSGAAASSRSPGCRRRWRARRRRAPPRRAARRAAAPPCLRRSARAAPAKCSTASGPARDGGDRRRRAAPTRPC